MFKKLTNSSNKKKLILNPISYTFFILHDLTFKCKRSDALNNKAIGLYVNSYFRIHL